jgi:hypothetical protein
MRQSLLVLIIGGLLLQSFSTVGILIHYQLNKEFIAKNLCENRNKPQMHCNGKCHLAKQLKKAEAEESKNHSKRINTQEFFSLFSSRSASVILVPDTKGTEMVFAYSNHYSSAYTGSPFHPPCC